MFASSCLPGDKSGCQSVVGACFQLSRHFLLAMLLSLMAIGGHCQPAGAFPEGISAVVKEMVDRSEAAGSKQGQEEEQDLLRTLKEQSAQRASCFPCLAFLGVFAFAQAFRLRWWMT